MKNQEASKKTISALQSISREHFTRYGYAEVSLERIAKEGNMTRGAVYHHFKNKKGLFLAVLEDVQKDIAAQIVKAAEKSKDPWQQLILGCLGFIKGANAKESKRILLMDAPAVVGWDAWRRADHENSMEVLKDHINDLKEKGYLKEGVAGKWMTYAVSGALNELSLHYSLQEGTETDNKISALVSQIVSGFKR